MSESLITRTVRSSELEDLIRRLAIEGKVIQEATVIAEDCYEIKVAAAWPPRDKPWPPKPKRKVKLA